MFGCVIKQHYKNALTKTPCRINYLLDFIFTVPTLTSKFNSVFDSLDYFLAWHVLMKL